VQNVLALAGLQLPALGDGLIELCEPLLDEYRNVENTDALLSVDAKGFTNG
jgi:hypothetical protein